jgi:hypothetical protein
MRAYRATFRPVLGPRSGLHLFRDALAVDHDVLARAFLEDRNAATEESEGALVLGEFRAKTFLDCGLGFIDERDFRVRDFLNEPGLLVLHADELLRVHALQHSRSVLLNELGEPDGQHVDQFRPDGLLQERVLDRTRSLA